MKKLITLAVIFFTTQSAFAQTEKVPGERTFKKFKTDVSFGYAKPQSSLTNGGALFAIEPKYAVMDQLAVGLRIEAAVTVRIDNTGAKSSSASANGSYLLTGDYYINNNKFRPFAGAGAGIFTTATVDDNTVLTSSGSLPTSSKFGFMTRVGFEYGHLRMGAEYNFVANKAGYLGLKIGVCIGGGRL